MTLLPWPEKAQFTHDSKCCTFVGRSADGVRDLYVCDIQGRRTCIARYGDDGPEYSSWPASMAQINPYAIEALAAVGKFHMASAEAALQRLQIAVEALEYCRMNMSKVLRGDLTDSAKEAAGIIHARAFNALHEIGEVPPA
jgi:hypothetical protein